MFKKLAQSHKEIKFVHIDIDEASDCMENELKDVKFVPMFFVFQHGKKIDTFQGTKIENLNAAVEKLLKVETSKEEKKENDKKEEKLGSEKPNEDVTSRIESLKLNEKRDIKILEAQEKESDKKLKRIYSLIFKVITKI